MRNYFDVVISNLRAIGQFSGRTGMKSFWPYTATVVVLTVAIFTALTLPGFVDSFQRMTRFAEEHPDQATVTRTATSISVSIRGYHPELMNSIGQFTWIIVSAVVLIVVLLAAAVVRRLHDTGKRGVWGILPLPFIGFSLPAMIYLLDSEETNEELFMFVFASNMLYLAALVVLIFLLCKQGQLAANRFGPVQPV